MTLFRPSFSYSAFKILRILLVEFIVPSDSRHFSNYALIKDSYGLNLLSVNGLESYVLTSTIGAENHLNGPSPPKMMFSENLRSNPKLVSKYLTGIILYLILVALAT